MPKTGARQSVFEEHPDLERARRLAEKVRTISAMRVCVETYISSFSHVCSRIGIVFPYIVHKDKTGRVVRLEPERGSIDMGGKGRLDWIESTIVTNDGKIRFPFYDYHFQPVKGSVLASFRVERTTDDAEGHVNIPENLQAGLGDHLRYSEGGTKVQIPNFNLLLATIVASLYILTHKYPFNDSNADEYNTRLMIARKRVEVK